MKQGSSVNTQIDDWLHERPWKLLWYGVPALLAGGLVLLVAILVLSQQTKELNARYDRLAKFLLATRNFEEAKVASLHGLADLKDDRARSQKLYYLALALNGLGRKQEAIQLMNEAAPLDRPGCLEAQLMIAQSLLSSTNVTSEALRGMPLNATNEATETLRNAERHLLNALARDPQSLVANELLGRFYINTHNPAKAQKYLMQIYSAKPETALLLAIVCLETNDQAGALQWAERAVPVYERKVVESAPHYRVEDLQGWQETARIMQTLSANQKPAPLSEATAPSVRADTNAPTQDGSAFWLSIARLLVKQGKYEPALETIEQQIHNPTNPVYGLAIGEVCAAWAGSIPADQQGGSSLRLQLLQKGLTNAPQLLPLQLVLAQASHAPDETGPAAKKLLDDAVAAVTNNEAAAGWQFVLWTDARLRGDLPTARRHLEAAYQLAPQNPLIKNDLAMDLLSGSREDAERALKLIQSLLDQSPEAPGLRDTRGQILAKLGRNEEAAADLEFAAARLPNPQKTQEVLAKVHAALGPTAPQAHPAALLGQARDLASQRKYAEALAKLEPEMRQSPNAAYASAIADICATWAEKTPARQTAERLGIIQKGLGYAPQHAGLMALLLQATHATGDSGPAARKLLDQLVASAVGEDAAAWHLLLGQDARTRGDLSAARQQLQTAYGLAPERTDIKTSLAGVLVAGNRDDWEEGLRLIQPALDEFSDNTEYRNTRGLLLARLGQNKAAAADLEYAVTKLPNPAESRIELAKVYDALGKSQLADQQRRLAASARKP